jgi:periplasmic copper chaperone A
VRRLSPKLFALGLASLAVTLPAAAQVQATAAWARGTVGGQTSTAVYMRLRSTEPAAVVAVDSPLGMAELHEMKMDGDVMRMRPLKRLELPAGRAVDLNPAGAHIMLTGLKRALVKGDRVPLRLTVETAGKARRTFQVTAEVRDFASADAR